MYDLFLTPSPQNRPFWGGAFWDKITNFCPFVIKKILGRLGTWADLPATYRPISGRFRPQTHNRNFKNMGFFAFLRIFGDFFFQNDDLVQNRPKIIKNGFFQLLWILKFIFIYFWTHFGKLKFWFFGIFFMPKPSISTGLL